MFARKVTVRLKPNSLTRFADLVAREILPWLRRQEGFLDLIILALTDSREVTTISFWNHVGNAEAYESIGYPEVLKVLAELLDGQPYVKTFEVVSSTFRQAGLGPLETDSVVHETDLARSGYHDQRAPRLL